VLKNQSLLTLALALMVSMSSISGVFALNYSSRQRNKATPEGGEAGDSDGCTSLAEADAAYPADPWESRV
jgi:hypothetical protein